MTNNDDGDDGGDSDGNEDGNDDGNSVTGSGYGGLIRSNGLIQPGRLGLAE